jgi:hypothetical protein
MKKSNEAASRFHKEKKEGDWRVTISGKIFARLEELASEKDVSVSIKNKGGMVEIFKFGDETANIVKHLEDAAVGEESGKVRSFVESWDYRNRDWWRGALDAENLPVQFLDTPAARAAQDAGIENWQEVFRPSVVVKTYDLADPKDEQGTKRMQEWVESEIEAKLADVVGPSYVVKTHDYLVRIVPVSEEANQSRVDENETYREMLERLKEAIPQIEEAYRLKQVEKKG